MHKLVSFHRGTNPYTILRKAIPVAAVVAKILLFAGLAVLVVAAWMNMGVWTGTTLNVWGFISVLVQIASVVAAIAGVAMGSFWLADNRDRLKRDYSDWIARREAEWGWQEDK